MTSSAILVLLVALGGVQEVPKPALLEAPPGQRFQLTDGQLFIPEGFKPAGGAADLTIHLHGTALRAELNLARTKQPGVSVTVTLPGLSGVYTEKFRDPAVFRRILEETRSKVADAAGAPELGVAPVTITSFSAGFGGVRELLKNPEAFARIDTLVMADSIYAGFTGDRARREVDPANMEGFVRFAREAVEGRKRMLVSHTELLTPNYASTAETADYLIKQLGGAREKVSEAWPGELQLQSRFVKGKLKIYGFAGDAGPDHMKHLFNVWQFLERIKD